MTDAYGRPYRRVRAWILARDPLCQCRGECGHHVGLCGQPSTEADHVVALADRGERLNPANLRGTCRPCNRRLGVQVKRRRAATRAVGPRVLPW